MKTVERIGGATGTAGLSNSGLMKIQQTITPTKRPEESKKQMKQTGQVVPVTFLSNYSRPRQHVPPGLICYYYSPSSFCGDWSHFTTSVGRSHNRGQIANYG